MRAHHAFRTAAALAVTMLAVGGSAVFAKPGQGGGGGGTSNNTAPKFDVTVTSHPGYTSGDDLWEPGSNCMGETPDAKTKEIVTVVFFHHQRCADLTTSDGTLLTDDLTIRTYNDANGDINLIQITGQDDIGKTGIAYRSEMIPPETNATPQRSGSFTIHVHKADATLHNCHEHRIKPNTACDLEASGTFSIDDITYTCVDYCDAVATIE